MRRLVPTARSKWAKAHENTALTIGDARLRRFRAADAASAQAIEGELSRAWRAGVAPEPLLRDGAELWLEFVDGEAVSGDDPALISELADLYAALFDIGTVQECPRRGGWVDSAQRDLVWLERLRILEPGNAAALRERVDALAPTQLWRGLDYVDLRPSNVVRRDGRLVIVDIESLSTAFPLGAGIAKAARTWLAGRSDELIEALAKRGAPDLRVSQPFVALCFLAWWQKRCALRGKWKAVDPSLFHAHLEA